MKAFADLAELPEDERIRAIADTAMHGHSVAFVVEDDEKADRYIEKLSKFNVTVTARGAGPVAGTVFVRVEKGRDH
jgi:uncharacterized membrane protein